MSIVLEHVKKAYSQGTAVVNDISLEIENGEFFVLLGSSGSGKSTLLRLIAGLTQADSGKIFLHGRDVTHLPPQKRNTGFVFQNYSLFRHMNAAQNIAFGLSIRNVARAVQEHRVKELLNLIQLPDLGRRMPSELSGGQQQRVALARALAHQPEVLLLDEPFGALDAKIRTQLRQNLREIQRRLGVTTILVTHDQDEAFELADRIGIIEKGQILEVGAPSALYRRPQNRFTATFLGTANLLHGHRNSHHIYVGDLALPVPPDSDHLANQDVEILFRPEEVRFAPLSADPRAQLIGRGVILEATFAGPMQRVSFKLAQGADMAPLTALLSADEANALDLTPGQEVLVELKNYHIIGDARDTAEERHPLAVS